MQNRPGLFVSGSRLLTPDSAMPLEVRPLTLDDYASMCCLEQQHHAHPWSNGHLADSLEHHHCVGLWERSRLIAHAILSFVAGEAELLLFVLHRDWRQKGIAAAFLRATMRESSRLAGSMFLEVRRGNLPAIHLYEACGFNEVGVRPAYYPGTKGREDALIYAAELAGSAQRFCKPV